MSNLSELLPAGGAAKEFEPVASGTLPNGQAVILNANGTITAVAETVLSQTIPAGSGAEFDSGSNHDNIMMAYDPTTAGRFAVVYSDANNGSYGTIVIGQVTGTSITFGTAIVFISAWSHAPRVSWSSLISGQLAIATGRSSKGRIVIGNVSGSNVTFGGESYFFNSGIPDHYDMAFDPLTANRLVCVYRDPNSSGYGMAVVGTVSGTSVTFGGAVQMRATNVAEIKISFDPNTANRFVVGYAMQVNSGYGQAQIGDISGTTINFGSAVTYSAGAATFHYICYDQKIAGKFYAAFQDSTNSDYGTAVCCTVSGTTISVGQIVVFNSGATQYVSIAGDPNTANRFLVSYRDNGNSGEGRIVSGTVSGTVISYASASVLSSSLSTSNVAFDPNNTGQFALCTNVPTGRAFLGQLAASLTNLTSTNFVGITAEAIADTATGKVNAKGGVASSVANIAPTMPFGSEYVFNAGTSIYTSMAFDPNNAKKFVAVYRDTSNSNYGTAIVGTVSGNSISYGPEVVFYSGQTAYTSIAFDPNTSGMFVVSYMDVTGGGSACAGTVSGTNITFGTAVVFETSEANYSTIAFDLSTAGKFIITYLIGISTGNAIVGTVSGTSIAFGTTVVFEAAKAEYPSVSFDPNDSGKFVIAYNDGGNSDYGTAIAGTISGTTPSFGSAAVFDSVACGRTNVSFDPNTAGKFVVAYRGGSEHGNAVVGTVSGTSLSFGSNVVFNNTVTSEMAISFDSGTGGKFVIAYQDDVNSEYGTAILGVLSGTSVSFSLKTVFNTGDTLYPSIAFDPNTAGEFVVTYRDVDNSNYGTSVVGNISNALTTGSDYYLQTDGTVSTATASPAINIGRAISPTSLILR